MMFKRVKGQGLRVKGLVLSLITYHLSLIICFASVPSQPESDQQIDDFSLSGYGQKGKKAWDLSGKSADIFTETVNLKKVTGNMYGENDNVKLTAEKGEFNKVEGKVHLEDDVVITTSSGTKLTTESLDWDRKKQLVTTKDYVNIEKENMVLEGVGANGQPNLKKVALDKDVKLNINPEETSGPGSADSVKEKIEIICDGPLEVDYDKNIACFNNNVKVTKENGTIYSDKMDIYFSGGKTMGALASGSAGMGSKSMASKINKIVARGNVKLIQGENTSYSDEAIYDAVTKKITLNGKPKLVIYSTQEVEASASPGN